MTFKKLSTIIEELIIDRNCSSREEKQWRAHLASIGAKQMIEYELDEQRSRKEMYDKLILKLIQIQDERRKNG